jgi:hypothetical protein
VEQFKETKGPALFLASLKAGGTGITLNTAEYVFLLDPWWNPAVEAQAVDRVHRIGQEDPVLIYRMIAPGTVEERIEELKQEKRCSLDRRGRHPGHDRLDAALLVPRRAHPSQRFPAAAASADGSRNATPKADHFAIRSYSSAPVRGHLGELADGQLLGTLTMPSISMASPVLRATPGLSTRTRSLAADEGFAALLGKTLEEEHGAGVAIGLHLVGDMAFHLGALGAFFLGILEHADAVELGVLEEGEHR